MTAWPVDEAPAAQPSRVVFRRAEHGLWQGQYSPNGRWLVFETLRSMVAGASLGVTAAEGPPDRPWIRVPLRQRWADKPRWSPDGKALYFLAADGSFIHLWAARFDPVGGVVVGEPVQLTHFDSPSFKISPAMSSTGDGRRRRQGLPDHGIDVGQHLDAGQRRPLSDRHDRSADLRDVFARLTHPKCRRSPEMSGALTAPTATRLFTPWTST